MKRMCVAGIGTMVGKTVASAVLCEASGSDYWKPIYTGTNDGATDTEIVASLISNGHERTHPERYLLKESLSPHAAAAREGIEIGLTDFTLPATDNSVVIELAGGLFVPLNDTHTNLDLIRHLDAPIVLVSRHYLGSINHTLLSLEALRTRNITVAGVLFNGDETPETERIIERLSGVAVLGRIPYLEMVNSLRIAEEARAMGGWW